MQSIHAGNMKSAFIRSQLEACKIGQKVKKKSSKNKNVFYLEGGKKGKGKRREKKRKKEEKMGIKIIFFYKSVRMFFFKCAVVTFQIYRA